MSKEIPEIAKQAAMQVIHGGLFSECNGPLPTVDQVAKVISDTLDLPWLLSIRRQREEIATPALIAAAPEMFEALRWLKETVSASFEPGAADWHRKDVEHALNLATETLDKLEKEQP